LLDILSNVCLKGKIFVHKVKGCINYNTFECVIICYKHPNSLTIVE
jgi:hypothetical protein